MELQEVKTAAENAVKAFEAIKSEVLPLKEKFENLDADTKQKFAKMTEDVNKGIEESQKVQAKQKAIEDNQKELESQVKSLETALARVPAAGNATSAADAIKQVSAKRNQLFNAYARLPLEQRDITFHSYIKQQVKDEMELKALSNDSDPNGGYLVYPELGGIIREKVYESSPIRMLASSITIGTNSYEVLLDNGEAEVEWAGERSTRNETDTPQLGKLIIYVNEMSAKPKATQSNLDDSTIDIESWLSGHVGDAMARAEATAFVSGNGVTRPKGILSYSAGTDIAAQQVQQVALRSASTVTHDGLVALQNSLKEDYQANAAFLFQRATNFDLMTIKDGEGRPIFNMGYDKNVGLEPTLLGKRAYFAADVPAVASNALAMIYGDIRRAYQIVDRTGIRVLRDPFTEKPFIIFYTTRRVGGALKNFEAVKVGKIAAS